MSFLVRIPRKRISFYLQHFAFCFSSYFSSSSGSAPLQPPQSAAAWPWSSQCRRNSDWGSPEGRRTKFVEPFGYELQPEVTRTPPKKVMGRHTTSLSARRKEMSGPPFTGTEEKSGFSLSIFSHDSSLRCISCPLYPWNPPPLYTGTQSKLCAPKYLSLLCFPSYLLIMSNTFTAFVFFFLLTSESRVRWGIDWWGIWSMWDGGARDIIGVNHVSPTLR